MDDLTILYFIIAMCCVMVIISAYLIYKNSQEEKKEYYKMKWRQEQAQGKPDYDIEKLAKVSAPKPPRMLPVAVVDPPAPLGLPQVEETVPLVDDKSDKAFIRVETHPVANSVVNKPQPAGIPEPPEPMIVAGGVIAGGALLTYDRTKNLPPVPKETPEPMQMQKKKKKKESQRVDDFDVYRDCSPTILPPAQKAPDAAQYDYPTEPEVQWTPSASRALPSSTARSGLEF